MKNNSENKLLKKIGLHINIQLNKKNWSQEKFAKMLYTANTEFFPHQSTISDYVCGKTEMHFYEFLCMCQQFECHSSVLLPITDQPKAKYQTIECLTTRKLYKQAFEKQFTFLVDAETSGSNRTRGEKERFLTDYTDAALELNFSDSHITIEPVTFYRYTKGLSNPSLLNMVVLCHLFNIELSDFFHNCPGKPIGF